MSTIVSGHCSFATKACVCVTIALGGAAFGQQDVARISPGVLVGALKGFGHGQDGGTQVPFPFLDKQIKFPVARLSKEHFIEMGAIKAVLPKGYAGKVKRDQQIILLNYGFKSGGIVRIFETPEIKGVSPVDFIKQVNEDGFFHNVKRGDWKLKPVLIKGVFVVSTSQNPAALESAVQDLKGR
jgi:hypothetical protein